MLKKQKGGEVQPFPLSYFNPSYSGNSVNPGQDLLKNSGTMVRNFLPRFGMKGGKNLTLRRTRKKGGFVPSIMEPFSTAASKYIAPIALFAAYKFMTKKTSKKLRGKSSTRQKRQKNKTRRSH
jgi:hypothetical protein